MKKQKVLLSAGSWMIILLASFFLFACKTSKWVIPSQYLGDWKTGKHEVVVRYKVNQEKHSRFIRDSAVIVLRINDDKTASGVIGLAPFEQGKILKNYTLWDTGVSYVIECGPVGKIFSNDPVETKLVALWLDSPDENGRIKAELRLGGRSVFPMADLIFERVDD